MISHRHRCIYVKVPKCASSSVRRWLLAHAGACHAYPRSWYPGSLSERIPPLARALDLWPDYFAFTFMRNPYRRFVSVYLHAERDARARAERNPHRPGTLGTLHEAAQLCAELLDDTRHLWGRQARAYRREHAHRRYGSSGIALRHLWFLAVHARPQVDFLPDCNSARLFGMPAGRPLRLSFIGAVETLDTDFARVGDALDLPPIALARTNASAPAPQALEAMRRDAPTRALVEALYAEDFAFARYPPGEVDGRAALLPCASGMRRASGMPRASDRPGASALRRAAFRLASAGIDFEASLRADPRLRRLFAPLARLRRSIP